MGLFVFPSRGVSSRFRFPFAGVVCLVACVALGRPFVACAGLLINEVYYDHPGVDAGHEYIELFNASGDTVFLADATIEFHNGSGVGWSVLWRGDGVASVAPGKFFVIGGADVRPLPHDVISLSLQNGPDAIRVTIGGVSIDVVGYGGLDDPAYVETRGVPPVASGQSIGRVPDGLDTDDNASDFVPLVPNPGFYNTPRQDAVIELDAGVPVRSAVASAGFASIRLRVHNGGTDPIVPGAVLISLSDSTQRGTEPAASQFNQTRIAPGESEATEFNVFLNAGYHWLNATVNLEFDERPGNDFVALIRRVGEIGLLVSEVFSYPIAPCPQFVEIYNASQLPVSIDGFAIRDRSHVPVAITGDSLVIHPGEFIVVTPNADDLRSCLPASKGAVVAMVGGTWPRFNRSGAGISDSVIVLDSQGIVVDAVAYPGLSGAQAGKSLERVNLYRGGRAVFLVSLDPAGATPGFPGERTIFSPLEMGDLAVQPNPFFPGNGGTLQVSIEAPAIVVTAVVSVFNIRGIEVATPGSVADFPAVIVWDGRTEGGEICEPGFYIVACEYFRADGSRHHVSRVVVASAAMGRG